MKAVILGGTSGMGREIARILAERGDRVFLLGRDPRELERSVADLATHRARATGADSTSTGARAANDGSANAGSTSTGARAANDGPANSGPANSGPANSDGANGFAVCDLEQPETFAPALDRADAALGGFDCVIVTAALFASQAELEADVELARRLVTVNFANTVTFCEHARKRLLARGGGRLVVFSSVAGERGRKPVAIYGASKAGLSTYLEALDHKFHAAGLRVTCVKPGFVHTAMTAGLPAPPFAGEPHDVAALVVHGIDRGAPVIYAPRMWALVMLAIRTLPRFVMRRIKF